MEYTINKLAKLAGVSTRTLRYYDEIDLLRPKRINSSGYRIYGEQEVDKLQQILLFRELDMKLDVIQELLAADTDPLTLLQQHKQALMARRNQLDRLLLLVDDTIEAKKGRKKMTDTQKFNAFKKDLIQQNETQYGEEIREKYGDATVDKSNAQLMNMTEAEYLAHQELNAQILDELAQADKLLVPSEDAEALFQMHKKWITSAWGYYNPEAHVGLAEMYVADQRFASYYNKVNPMAAEKIREIITFYA